MVAETSFSLKHLNLNKCFINFLFKSEKIDILEITETHLDGDIMYEEVKVDRYTFFRNDRKTGPGGGVGCFICNDLGWQRQTDLENYGVEEDMGR